MDLIGKMEKKIKTVESVVQPVVQQIIRPVVRASVGGVPPNVLRNDDGTPIRNDDGGYIYTK